MNFFILLSEQGKLFGTKWAYAEIMEPSNAGGAEECPVCHRAVSMLRWLAPYRIRLSSKNSEKWGDLLWGAGFPLLVSKRFKDIYESESLSGISEFSPAVEVIQMGSLKKGVFPTPPPEYYLVHIPWGGANQDDRASCVEYENPEKITCKYCRVDATHRKQRGIIIEEGSWDGRDIFIARGGLLKLMISDQFKNVMETHLLTNAWFIPSEKFGYDAQRPGRWYLLD